MRNIKHYILPRQSGKTTRIIKRAAVSSADMVVIITANGIMFDEFNRQYARYSANNPSKQVVIVQYSQLESWKEGGIVKLPKYKTVFKPEHSVDIFVDELMIAVKYNNNNLWFGSIIDGIFDSAIDENSINVEAYSTPTKQYNIYDYIEWCISGRSNLAKEYRSSLLDRQYVVTKYPNDLATVRHDSTDKIAAIGLQQFITQGLAELFTMNNTNVK